MSTFGFTELPFSVHPDRLPTDLPHVVFGHPHEFGHPLKRLRNGINYCDKPTAAPPGLFRVTTADSTVIYVYPGDGDWTRIFSDAVGPEGRVYSFVPAEVAHFKNDPVGRMRTLAKEARRENAEVVSADLAPML